MLTNVKGDCSSAESRNEGNGSNGTKTEEPSAEHDARSLKSMGLRERCYVLFEDADSSLTAKWTATFVMVTILVSTVGFVADTIPGTRGRDAKCKSARSVENCRPTSHPVFESIELVCIILFTIDYLARILTVHATRNIYRAEAASIRVTEANQASAIQRASNMSGIELTLRYMCIPMNVIDLAAILPFYVETFLGGGGKELQVVRVLRLARVFRIFKLGKHNKGAGMWTEVMSDSLPALCILVFFSTICVVLFGSLIYFCEGSRFSTAEWLTNSSSTAHNADYHKTGAFVREAKEGHDDVLTPFRSIPMSFWWVCITMTTVGYGDIFPTTSAGKVIGTLLFYIGVIQLALPITILGRNFERVYRRQHGAHHLLTEEEKETRKKKFYDDALAEFKANDDANNAPFFPSSRWGGMRQRLFTLMEDANASRLGKFINVAVMVAILLSTCTFVMETDEYFTETTEAECLVSLSVKDCEPKPVKVFEIIEEICVALFLVEYLARICTVHAVSHEQAGLSRDRGGVANTIFYMLTPLNIIDFVAIVPYYVQKIVGASGGGLAVLRVLRLIRVFRIFKMGKYSSGAFMVVRAVSNSLPALSMLFFLTCLACVLFSSCIYYAEGQQFSIDQLCTDNGFPDGCYVRPSVDGYTTEVSPFVSIPFAFWWFFTTTTTVGYGDFSPTTTGGMVIAVLTAYIGIILLALPITIIGGSFSSEYEAWIDEASAMEDARSQARKKSIMDMEMVQGKKSNGASVHPETVAAGPAAGPEAQI